MQREPRIIRRPGWRDRLRDPRPVLAIVGSAGLVALALFLLVGRGPGAAGDPSGALPTVLDATFSPLPEQTPVPPDTTPEGVTRVAETSAPVTPRPGVPVTPTPDPKVWRFEGIIVDEDGKPLEKVCVIVGPHGCQRGSVRTDEHGRYFIDMPQSQTVYYDLYFALEGYEVVWHRAQPNGPTVFNVILRRA